MSDQSLRDIPLPSGWAKNVKSPALHIISLAYYAIATARGWAANSINARVRLAAKNDRLKQETELLRQEIRIEDVRMAKLGTHAALIAEEASDGNLPQVLVRRPRPNDSGAQACHAALSAGAGGGIYGGSSQHRQGIRGGAGTRRPDAVWVPA